MEEEGEKAEGERFRALLRGAVGCWRVRLAGPRVVGVPFQAALEGGWAARAGS